MSEASGLEGTVSLPGGATSVACWPSSAGLQGPSGDGAGPLLESPSASLLVLW